MVVAKTNPVTYPVTQARVAFARDNAAASQTQAVAAVHDMRMVYAFVAALLLTVFAALSYMTLHASIATANLEINRLETIMSRLQQQRESSEVRIAELSSHERIERDARCYLKMQNDPSRMMIATLPSDDGPAPSPTARPGEVRVRPGETLMARIGRWIASIGYAQASTGE